MGKFYDEIPDFLIDWIPKQEVFWVATAPLSGEGHVNVSPKGLQGTFHIESPTRVWYEDMTGSGSETIAHLRENKRVTIMFSAFEGPPRVTRLFATGIVHEWGTPEYVRYIPAQSRTPGSRSVIVMDVHKVSTACGYGVPYFEFKGQRTLHTDYSTKLERRDIAYEAEHPDAAATDFAGNGIKAYWKQHSQSIDGLPSIQCYASGQPIVHAASAADVKRAEATVGEPPATESGRGEKGRAHCRKVLVESGPTLLVGITLGLAIAAVAGRLMGTAALGR